MIENNLNLEKYSITLEFEDAINNSSTALLFKLVHKINNFTLVNAMLFTKDAIKEKLLKNFDLSIKKEIEQEIPFLEKSCLESQKTVPHIFLRTKSNILSGRWDLLHCLRAFGRSDSTKNQFESLQGKIDEQLIVRFSSLNLADSTVENLIEMMAEVTTATRSQGLECLETLHSRASEEILRIGFRMLVEALYFELIPECLKRYYSDNLEIKRKQMIVTEAIISIGAADPPEILKEKCFDLWNREMTSAE